MAASDMIVTIPGTNTAEVAIIGTPMISIFPLDSSNMIPLEGIWEIIGKLPLLGYVFKKYYVKIMQKRIRFFAIPNIKTGRSIVPELLGKIQAVDVAEKVDALLNDTDTLKEMSGQLKAALGKPGAARMIAEEILNEALRQTY
jgi:lipid A disaccharide synthetase